MEGLSPSASTMTLESIGAQRQNSAAYKEAVARETLERFESVFISSLLKEMRQTTEGEGLFAGDPSDSLGGLFDMFMGQYLAQGGGLGIAKMMAASMQNGPVSNSPTPSDGAQQEASPCGATQDDAAANDLSQQEASHG